MHHIIEGVLRGYGEFATVEEPKECQAAGRPLHDIIVIIRALGKD